MLRLDAAVIEALQEVAGEFDLVDPWRFMWARSACGSLCA